MLWNDERPSLAVHPIETEHPQTQALARGFIAESGALGSVWFKGHSVCQLQVIIPGKLAHAQVWPNEETAWTEAARVIEQWEKEEKCKPHQVVKLEEDRFMCLKCGQKRESRKGSRSDA